MGLVSLPPAIWWLVMRKIINVGWPPLKMAQDWLDAHMETNGRDVEKS
jgi:hypothetical protein